MTELVDKKGLTEAEYLKIYKEKNYPKPALTADVILLGDNRSRVLLIRRGGHPYLGCWAFPGGFAETGETIETTAKRELEEETGLTGIRPDLVGVFSKPGRDPRGWVVSVAYSADVKVEECRARANDDADSAEWFFLQKEGNRICLKGNGAEIIFTFRVSDDGIKIMFETPQKLAFDHAEILAAVLLST